MTLPEAEKIAFIVKAIKDSEHLDNRLQKLFKEGKPEEIVRIALELNSELKRVYEDKLAGFPSLNRVEPCLPVSGNIPRPGEVE